MEHIVPVIERLKSTNSNPEKMAILLNSSHKKDVVDFLQFIYNPYIRTGIAKKKLEKDLGLKPTPLLSIQDVIQYFTKRQTGAHEDVIFAQMFVKQQPTPESKALAEAMVTKNLKIGLTAVTLNKVFGEDFIPKIGCMLGMEWSENKHKVKGPFIVTEKLDGVRRLLIKENNVISFYSRSGIQDSGLIELEEEAKYLPNNMVYDGELLALGSFSNSIELRQASASIANRKNSIKTGLTFNTFDAVPLDEFKAGKSRFGAADRKAVLGAMLSDDSIRHIREDWAQMIAAFRIYHDLTLIRPVPILGVAHTDYDIEKIVAPIYKEKGEGVMLNTMDGRYEIKRSKHLLKVKDTQTLELPVVDLQEGIGKYKGMLGAFIAEYKGTRVGVGSGLTDAQRQEYWDEKFIGSKIEIDTFGESKDKTGNVSLNCPIFKRLWY